MRCHNPVRVLASTLERVVERQRRPDHELAITTAASSHNWTHPTRLFGIRIKTARAHRR
jgi:hypothetical protein